MPPRKKTTWLLVGDGSSAQLYSVHAVPMRVTKVPSGAIKASRKAIRGPEHRAETRHIAHNTSGRAVQQRHENVFVEQVAATLDAAAVAGNFDQVIVVLPPKALAHFRKIIGAEASKRIKQEIRSEWTHLSMPDIEKRLAARLP